MSAIVNFPREQRRDAWAFFRLILHGVEADIGDPFHTAVEQFVEGVTWQESEDAASVLTIEAAIPDKQGFGQPTLAAMTTDSKIFAEGNSIDIFAGYTDLRFMGRAEIVKWVPTFPERGMPRLRIRAYDGRHRMAQNIPERTGSRKRIRATFKNKSDSEIVTSIARKYGFASKVDALSIKRKRVQKVSETDWSFIRRLARIHNYIVFVAFDLDEDNYVVNFIKDRDDGNAVAVLEYRPEDGRTGSLLSAQFSFQLTGQPTNITLLGMDRKKRTIDNVFVAEDSGGETVKLIDAGPEDLDAKEGFAVGSRVRFEAFGSVFETFTNRPFTNKREAKEFVEKYLREREKEFLTVRGTAVGFEIMRVLDIVELRGLGNRLSGSYRLTDVTHSIRRGGIFKTSFDAYRVVDPEMTRLPRRKAKAKTETGDGVLDFDDEPMDIKVNKPPRRPVDSGVLEFTEEEGLSI